MIEQQKQEFLEAIKQNKIVETKGFIEILLKENKEIAAPIFHEALNQAISSSYEDMKNKQKEDAVFYILHKFSLLLKKNDKSISTLAAAGDEKFKHFHSQLETVKLDFINASLKAIFVLPYNNKLLQYIFNKMGEIQKNLMAVLMLLAQISAIKELSYINLDWIKMILPDTRKKTNFFIKNITDLNIPNQATTARNVWAPRESAEESFYNQLYKLLINNSGKKLDQEIEVFFKFIELDLRAHPSLLKNINWKNAFFQGHKPESNIFLLDGPSPQVGR